MQGKPNTLIVGITRALPKMGAEEARAISMLECARIDNCLRGIKHGEKVGFAITENELRKISKIVRAGQSAPREIINNPLLLMAANAIYRGYKVIPLDSAVARAIHANALMWESGEKFQANRRAKNMYQNIVAEKPVVSFMSNALAQEFARSVPREFRIALAPKKLEDSVSKHMKERSFKIVEPHEERFIKNLTKFGIPYKITGPQKKYSPRPK